MRFQAVSFDLGHTLLLPRYEVYTGMLTRLGVAADRAAIVAVESRLRPWFDRLVLGSEELENPWVEYYRRFFELLGVDREQTTPLLLDLREHFREGIGLWTEPAPGATEVLQELRGQGLRLACVSNNDGRLQAMVEAQGWADCFDVLVDSEKVGVSKPDPRIFDFALEGLGLPPDQLVHVGDYYSTDVVGARRAGVEGVLYDPQGAYGPLDCPVVHDLRELPGLLA
jgi:HAD superfamily hydrolase (TIGR01509 family)